jgi:hypothetical protein
MDKTSGDPEDLFSDGVKPHPSPVSASSAYHMANHGSWLSLRGSDPRNREGARHGSVSRSREDPALSPVGPRREGV